MSDVIKDVIEREVTELAFYLKRQSLYMGVLDIETKLKELLVMRETLQPLNLPNNDPGPNAERPTPIEVKTVGQLIDELSILNIRIWMLIDKVKIGIATPEEAQKVQEYNSRRNEYVRAIDRRLGGMDLGAKIYNTINEAKR